MLKNPERKRKSFFSFKVQNFHKIWTLEKSCRNNEIWTAVKLDKKEWKEYTEELCLEIGR